MGTQVDRLPVQGIAIPSDLISLDTLRPTDAATPASTYTQAGGAAGDARNDDVTSRLELGLTGGQDAEIEVKVVRAGLPGVDGLGIAYRFTSEATADTVEEAWRGLGEPVCLADQYGIGQAAWSYDVVSTAGSHDLLHFYVVHGTPGGVGCRKWTGVDWGAVITVGTGGATPIQPDPSDCDACTAVAMPDGSVLAIARRTSTALSCWTSTDSGATWEEWSYFAGTMGGSEPVLRSCYYRGDVLLLSADGATLRQYVSVDLGAQFNQVYTGAVLYTSAVSNGAASCAAAPWGIVVAYLQVTTGAVFVRVLGSAGQPFDTATAVEVDATAIFNSVAVVVDGRGVVYVYAATEYLVRVFRSLDRGSTWTVLQANLVRFPSASSSLYWPTNLAACLWRGRAVVPFQVYEDPAGSPVLIEEPSCAFSGGWANLVPTIPVASLLPTSWLVGQTIVGSPSTMGWTAGGTDAAVVAPGRYAYWNVIAATGFFSVSAGTEPAVVFQASCLVDGTPSVATLTHGATLRKSNGVYEYILEVRIGADSIVAYDRNGSVSLGALAIDCTDWVSFYAAIDSNNKAIVYAKAASSSRWLRVCAIATLTNNAATPAAAGLVAFGIANAATVVAYWRCLARDVAEKYRCGLTTVVPATSAALFAPMDVGGQIGAAGSPLPDVGSSTRTALISARRGPGRRGERVVISPVHDYALANVFPRLGESPDRVWRATDKAAFSLVFDLGDEGGKLGHDWLRVLGMLRTNFRKAYLDSSVDGTTWTNRDIWDASTGFSTDLEYELQGQTIRPTTGSAAGARPLHRNELVGGFVVLDNTHAFEIAGNSAGVWNAPSGTTKWAEIQLVGDLTLAASTGAVVIVWPNAVHVGRFAGVSPTVVDRFWRVRTEANEATPWSYYQIGSLFLGTPVVFGKRSSRAWQREARPNVSTSTSRYGTIRKRQDGPPAGRWTLGWADGEQQRFHRAGLTGVDYVRAGSSGPALAMRDDVYESVRALLEETRSGEVPVLALAAIPSTDQTITDRTLFLYGSLDGGPSFGQVEGREGYDAFGRVDPITIDEIR